MIRQAISPRLAINILVNTIYLSYQGTVALDLGVKPQAPLKM
jgi:hypothetical protein